MSLLPRALLVNDPLSPLGKLVVREEAVKPDPNAWFDEEGRKHPNDKPPILGSAQDSRKTAEVGTTRPSPVAAPPSPATPAAVPAFKVGDRVSHKRVASLHLVVDAVDWRGIWCSKEGEAPKRYLYDETVLELLPSKPTEDSEVEWVEHKFGDRSPLRGGERWQYRLAEPAHSADYTAPNGCYQSGVLTANGDEAWRGWGPNTRSSRITAYRVLK